MKFTEKKEVYRNPHFIGRKNNFIFNYSLNNLSWMVVVKHSKKDIRFNSLWEEIAFSDEKEVIEWCENFDYTKYKCIGDDVIKKENL